MKTTGSIIRFSVALAVCFALAAALAAVSGEQTAARFVAAFPPLLVVALSLRTLSRRVMGARRNDAETATVPAPSYRSHPPEIPLPRLPRQSAGPRALHEMKRMRERAEQETAADARAFLGGALHQRPSMPEGVLLIAMALVAALLCARDLVTLWGPATLLLFVPPLLIGIAEVARTRPRGEAFLRGSGDRAYAAYRSVGSIGGNLASNTVFPQGSTAFGLAGEVKTAQILDRWLGDLSRVAVFHSVRFPGSRDADIDHVVLIGDEVVLVDSKAWRAGQYRQVSPETIIVDGSEERTSSMPSAAEKMQQILGAPVRAVTVIHPTSGVVELPDEDRATRFVNAVVGSPTMVCLLLTIRLADTRPWTRRRSAVFERRCQMLSSTTVASHPARAARRPLT